VLSRSGIDALTSTKFVLMKETHAIITAAVEAGGVVAVEEEVLASPTVQETVVGVAVEGVLVLDQGRAQFPDVHGQEVPPVAAVPRRVRPLLPAVFALALRFLRVLDLCHGHHRGGKIVFVWCARHHAAVHQSAPVLPHHGDACALRLILRVTDAEILEVLPRGDGGRRPASLDLVHPLIVDTAAEGALAGADHLLGGGDE